ncbi:MAG: PAS domain S-box protein, partial [Gemmatimonadaceae bacterium]|nr:PAS domain S-box protein [Gemmatimonadaceae bacterium]
MLDFARPAGVARRYLRWRLLLVITGSLIAIALAPATVRALPRWAQLLWVAWALAAALSYVLGRGASPGVQRRLQLLVSLVDAPSIALLTAAGGVGTSLAAPLLAINVAASGGRLGPRAGTALLALCEASLIVAWLPTLVAPGTRLAPILVVALVLQGLTLVVLAVFQGMASRIARASREQWVRLFDAVPDLIFVLDRNAEVLLANRAAERITGYDQATLRGGRLARFMPEESRSAAIARMDRTLAGEPMVYEATARRADGSPLHTRLHTVPLVEDGVISGALAVVHDLTAQKRDAEERERMAQALEESRRLLEGIVRTQASGLYLFDLAGRRATFMNDAMQELLGLDVARLAAMTHAERRET